MTQKAKKRRTSWHRLFGEMQSLLLTPLGITVQLEVEVLTAPPKMDVLILRNDRDQWTEAQRECLPDGIRDANAHYNVIEFKYTESFNEAAVGQAFTYDLQLKSKLKTSDGEVQTFLVCSKSPQKKALKRFGYQAKISGIYQSKQALVEHVTVISLNELANTPHNAAFKAFASTRQEKGKAFEFLLGKAEGWKKNVIMYSNVLYRYWFQEERSFMITELTSEDILEMGEVWCKALIQTASPEHRLEGLSPEELLTALREKDRGQLLRVIPAEERLKGLPAEELLTALSGKERQKMLKLLLDSGIKP